MILDEKLLTDILTRRNLFLEALYKTATTLQNQDLGEQNLRHLINAKHAISKTFFGIPLGKPVEHDRIMTAAVGSLLYNRFNDPDFQKSLDAFINIESRVETDLSDLPYQLIKSLLKLESAINDTYIKKSNKVAYEPIVELVGTYAIIAVIATTQAYGTKKQNTGEEK